MTLEQFINKLNDLKTLPSWKYHKDDIVCVKTNDPRVGPSSVTLVTSFGSGFDWDKHRFMITCEDTLFKTPRDTL